MRCPNCDQADLITVSLSLPFPATVRPDSTEHILHMWKCPACKEGFIPTEELQRATSAVEDKPEGNG